MAGCTARAAQAAGPPPAILATAPGAPCAAPRTESPHPPRRNAVSQYRPTLRARRHRMPTCERSHPQSFGAFFFPPASGKIHIETIMKAAVARTKFPNSGRTGEPVQKARMTVTTATAPETQALTSFGMALRPLLGGHERHRDEIKNFPPASPRLDPAALASRAGFA